MTSFLASPSRPTRIGSKPTKRRFQRHFKHEDTQDYLDKYPDQAIDIMDKGSKGAVARTTLERMVKQSTFGLGVRKISDIAKENSQFIQTQVDIKTLDKMPLSGIFHD